MSAIRPAVRMLVAAVLASPLAAQQTWIVDPTGGPFRDLQTAITAATPGDTILVRGGSHGNVIVDRSLHLLGDGTRPGVSTLSCWPGTIVTIGTMDLGSISLPSCRVAMDDVRAGQVAVTNSAAVFVRCTIDASATSTGTTSIAGSRVVFDRCTLIGSRGFWIQTLQCTPFPGAPALVVDGSSVVDLALSSCTGGAPLVFACLNSPGTNGISVAAGGVVRASHSTVAGGGPSVAAVVGAGTVLGDRTQFVPAYPATPAFLPVTTGQGAAPGGTLTARVVSDPLLPAAVVASFGLSAPVAVPPGIAWIDTAAFVVLRIGLLDASGALPVGIPLPPGLTRGVTLTVQSVVSPLGSTALIAASPTVLQVL